MARPRRLPAHSYTGANRYFLTLCTQQRAPHFLDAAVVAFTMSSFVRTATEESIAIIAYCVMPDHLHALVEGTSEDADMRRFVERAKQFSGWEFRRQKAGVLWQKGYYEHVVRDSEKIEEIVSYIVNNPLRKDLAQSPGDYPHWGSTVYSRREILDFIGQGRRRRHGGAP